MSDPAVRRVSPARRWPMTGEAWRRLVDELERLRADVVVLAGGAPPNDGIVHLPVTQAARRLETLTAVLDNAEEVDGAAGAVIGRRVTLREEEGDEAAYSIVFPGDGDPSQGWISADSPLGSAVLGAEVGDRIEVVAPAGRRFVTVVAID